MRNYFEQRRSIILAALTAPLAGCASVQPAVGASDGSFLAAMRAIETPPGERIGVAAFDTSGRRWLNHRGDERFPMCSTFKIMPAAAMLARGSELL
ncbi:MAG: class A beta-lactamase, partial [Massilia sp.]